MGMGSEEFRGVIERHQRMVYSIAVRVTGDFATAEEVAQDVFLALYRTAQQPGGEEHLRFWLRRVAVQRSTDALRRRSVRPESAAEEWMEEQHGDVSWPEPGVRSAALEARVEDLLRALPEAMRVVTVLRYQEEMRPDEIAAMLGVPVATVKSQLQRGLKLLRRKASVVMKEYVRDGA